MRPESPPLGGRPRSLGFVMFSPRRDLDTKPVHTGHAKNGALDRRDRLINERLGKLSTDALVVNIGCGVVRRFESACAGHFLATDIRHLPTVDFASDASALPLLDGSVDVVIALEMSRARRRAGRGTARDRTGAQTRRDRGRLGAVNGAPP